MRLRGLVRHYGDTALSLAFAVLVLWEIWPETEHEQMPLRLLGLVATLPVALRRRFPISTFLVVWSGIYGLSWGIPGFVDTTFGYALILMFTVFNVGARASGAGVWIAVAAIFVCITLLVTRPSGVQEFGDVVLVTIFVGTPWGFGTAVRLHRERKVADANRTSRLLAEEAARSAAALEAERAQIARELHDVVSHAMAVTLMQARGGRRVQASDPQAARAAFEAIESTNSQAIGDMRRMLNVLRETGTSERATGPLPSLGDLPSLVGRVRASGMDVVAIVDGDIGQVPPAISISAYRIIQEALTNVLKHAAAAQTSVTVHCNVDELVLDVTDRGHQSPDAARASEGHGIQGIKERVAAFGGTVRIGPVLPIGFAVRVQLPYHSTR